MTVNDNEPRTNTIDWQTQTLPSGRVYTSAHIGDITVSGHTVSVILDLDPSWFEKGRAKGRSEDILSGPALTTGHDITTLSFHVESPDVDPDRYLVFAPDALMTFRPQWAPKLTWRPRKVDGYHLHDATIATITDADGRSRPVLVRYEPKLTQELSDYAVGTLDDRFVVLVASMDLTAAEVFDRLAASRTFY